MSDSAQVTVTAVASAEAVPGGSVPTIGGIALTVNRYVVAAIVLDLVGFWFHVQGLKHAGSSVFQVRDTQATSP